MKTFSSPVLAALASAASLGRLMRQHLGQSPGALRAQRAASPSP